MSFYQNYKQKNIDPFVFKEARKVCLIGNYRTGSTTIIKNICETNNLNLHEFTAGCGEIFGNFEDLHNKEMKDFYRMNFEFHKFNRPLRKFYDFDYMINQINYMKFSIKLMPDQLYYDKIKIKKVTDIMDSVCYIYRKDFLSQCLSLITSVYGDKISGKLSLNKFFRPEELVEFNVPKLSSVEIERPINLLKKNYITMGSIMKDCPGKIYCYEDLPSMCNRYAKTASWSNDVESIVKDMIAGFDVEKTLFG